MQVCNLSLTWLCSVMHWNEPVTIPGPESPIFTSHYERECCCCCFHVLCFKTPSGVFSITCIISLGAWGVYGRPTWTGDHFSRSVWMGGGDISQLQLSKITWDGIYCPITVKEGNTCCRTPHDICRTLPTCCWVDDLSAMAFFQTGRNSQTVCSYLYMRQAAQLGDRHRC